MQSACLLTSTRLSCRQPATPADDHTYSWSYLLIDLWTGLRGELRAVPGPCWDTRLGAATAAEPFDGAVAARESSGRLGIRERPILWHKGDLE